MRVFASIVSTTPRAVTRFSWRATARIAALAFTTVALASCNLNPNVSACSVTVAPSTIVIPVNGRLALIGTAFDCSGNSIKTKTINYTSANTAIATVTTDGSVIGVSVGQTTVSAVAIGKEGVAQVTVSPELAASITVSPATITLRVSNQRVFTAVVKNSSGAVMTGRTVRWSSSNSSIAAVDQTGNVIALTPGTAAIAADVDGSSSLAQVTITNIPVGSCTLSPSTQKVTVTQQAQPVISLRDTANGVLSNTNRPITWTSDNEVVATVSTTGVITSRKAGTARITASPSEYPSITCITTLEAVDPRIVSATISPRTGSLRIGTPRQLTVSLADSIGGQIPPGRVVSWSSSTPSVATVSATGLVTGLSLGTARIVVTAEGAKDSVSFSVTKVPVATVRLSPLSSSVMQGQTQQFTPTVEDSTGVVVTDRVIEWSSSDPTKATVNTTGLVTTIAPGAVTITAISETRSGSASLGIQQIPVDTIVAADYSVVLNVANKSFAITLKDANGNQLFGRTVSITSSVPSVATGGVNQNATVVVVTASTVGTTTLSLRALNANNLAEGKTTNVVVTILPVPTPP